jgi:hypothetical protein
VAAASRTRRCDTRISFDETGEVEYTFTDPTGERKKDMLRSYDDVLRSARERVKRLQQ